MISLLWQDSVLSLLDQSVYPQEERWLTCTSLEETVQVLSSGVILEEKIAAIAGAYGLCQAALAAQDLQQTPQVEEVLAGARAMLLESDFGHLRPNEDLPIGGAGFQRRWREVDGVGGTAPVPF